MKTTRPDYKPTEPGFGAAFIDVDEWRDHPRPHRYVHGGFEDTHTLFSAYFPPAEYYHGRFFKYLEGGAGGHEDLLSGGGTAAAVRMPMTWAFDLAYDQLGGYLLESNQGHYHNEGLGFANDVELFGASAECARFSKFLAAEMYGTAPHHGYVWGPSGGGSRSIWCLENRPDVFDGGSPHVIGSGGIGQQWSAWAYWWMYARNKLPQIIDAMQPGGSGDPFARLTSDEREALATLYRWGWPRRGETLLWSFGPWLFMIYNLKDDDPTYFDDFWSKPGYLGHDSPERLEPFRIDRTFTVAKVLSASEPMVMAGIVRTATAGAVSTTAAKPGFAGSSYGIVLDDDLGDPQKFCMAKVTIASGKAKGREVYISTVDGATLVGFGEKAPLLFDDVEPGDEVHVDNRDYIAYAHFHRYALNLARYRKLDPNGEASIGAGLGGVFAETVDARPVHPQRAFKEPAGNDHSGIFKVKMIHMNAAVDSMVWPVAVVQYTEKVKAHLGEKIDDLYRIWFIDNAPHGDPQILGPLTTSERDPGVWQSRLVDYNGATAEALRALVGWVEHGVAPLPSTNYHMTHDGGLYLPETAEARAGVQPVVSAQANGAARAEVKVGKPVTFSGRAEMPPGAGTIVYAAWDYPGTGDFSDRLEIAGDNLSFEATTEHVYDKPGVYFASFRVGGHTLGKQGRGPAVMNLARVRVVVSA